MANQFSPMYRPGIIQAAMKSGAKDPRTITGNVNGFNPSYQPDVTQFYQDANAEYGNLVSMPDAVQQSTQTFPSQSRIQANYTQFPFVGTIPSAATPLLLIPRNNNRSNFYVINLSAFTIYLTFDQSAQPGSGLYGFPIAAPGGNTLPWFSETNGVIGINDIYISGGAASHASAVVLGYEGVPIITSAING